MRGRGFVAAVLTAGVLLFTPAVAANAAPPTDTASLREAVTVEAVRAHQAEFQEFADLSGGTREASTLGYQLSADYVADLMEAAGYEVTRQPFEYNFFEELAAPVVTGTRRGSRSPTPTVRTSRRWTTPAQARSPGSSRA